MFRLSSRALAKLITVLPPRRYLPDSTRTCLCPCQRSVADSTMRFSSIPHKSNKSYGLKNIGKRNSFEIEAIKFTFGIEQFICNKNKIVSISECDVKKANKHICGIWISIPASHILLEKFEEISKIIDNGVEWAAKEQCLSRFIDEERNYLIELKLADHNLFYRLRNNENKCYLQVYARHLDKPKGQSIFIPLNGIIIFHQKLSNILQHYTKWSDPSRQHAFEKLYTRFFFFGPKQYFLNLNRWNVTNVIFVGLCECNKENGKARNIFVPIAAASTLFDLLEEGYKVIQRYEGCLPSGMQPLDVLHEKSFTHEDDEFSVQVQVMKPQLHHLGNTILMIWIRDLVKGHRNNIMIGGQGAHLLLHEFAEVLIEYERLKPSLAETDLPKHSELIEEPRKQLSDRETTILKTEGEPKVTDLKDRKSAEEDCRKEIANSDVNLPKSLNKLVNEFLSRFC